MRRTVQLLAVLAWGVLAASAHGAEYTVVTCSGQAAGVGGWAGVTTGSHPAKITENCTASGGVMAAVLSATQSPAAGTATWQVSAPANTVIAGATLYRKVGVAGTGYGYVARGLTPAAANYQMFENCSGPTACKDEIARTSFAWRSPRADVNRLQPTSSA